MKKINHASYEAPQFKFNCYELNGILCESGGSSSTMGTEIEEIDEEEYTW